MDHDFEKAYDSLDVDFMLAVCEKFGLVRIFYRDAQTARRPSLASLVRPRDGNVSSIRSELAGSTERGAACRSWVGPLLPSDHVVGG
jgi:hypothetical protein